MFYHSFVIFLMFILLQHSYCYFLFWGLLAQHFISRAVAGQMGASVCFKDSLWLNLLDFRHDKFFRECEDKSGNCSHPQFVGTCSSNLTVSAFILPPTTENTVKESITFQLVQAQLFFSYMYSTWAVKLCCMSVIYYSYLLCWYFHLNNFLVSF